ncbi:hypothetical protein IM725_03695 [Ramlibacter aquaticus]|uniref:STAS/SEC14 domain-containing protein n=1 Tax=Ramlibacter aquaticus TaxID=2780094 RepID=A0ABR9SBK8_9BURK|nr:hypothetical protein [Ramlibacter aquaticus]MBE7939676.1 hypothetical protein [Ramlibacter aquaticus]
MIFNLSIHHGPRYPIVIGTGPGSLADLCAACNFAAEAGLRTGRNYLVVDFLAVDISLSDVERKTLGQHSAQQFVHLSKVALVMQPEFWNGVAEATAREAGLDIRIFHTLETATTWLNADPGATSR